MNARQTRTMVRENYAAIATRGHAGGCCAPAPGGDADSCCVTSTALGYSAEQLAAVPSGADLGLGCGNPQAIANLEPGQRVLDLGSGAGLDVFLAAQAVGPKGRVTGVDMTPEMIAKARGNQARLGLSNVEFKHGEIERLPLDDASIDVVISNCVVNLSPDKPAVFREAYRVLAPGGRLAISDVVAIRPLPAALAADPTAYCGCVGGAAPVDELRRHLADAGFTDVTIDVKTGDDVVKEWLPGQQVERYVASASIQARKPAQTGDRETTPEACCDTVVLESCCAPAAKSECCGPQPSESRCGCQ